MSEAIAYPPPPRPLTRRIADMNVGDTFAVDTTLGALNTTVSKMRKLYPQWELLTGIDKDGRPRVWREK